LVSFLNRESVTIALLVTALMLFLVATAPSVFHNTLLVAGLVGVWAAIVMTTVNRLQE
jgi:hypothetical protein